MSGCSVFSPAQVHTCLLPHQTLGGSEGGGGGSGLMEI